MVVYVFAELESPTVEIHYSSDVQIPPVVRLKDYAFHVQNDEKQDDR